MMNELTLVSIFMMMFISLWLINSNSNSTSYRPMKSFGYLQAYMNGFEKGIKSD